MGAGVSRIETIDVIPVRIPVKAAFNFATGSVRPDAGAPHVFVRVSDSDGVVGWGEARPSVGWSYETPHTVVSTLRHYLAPVLRGIHLHDIQQLHEQMQRTLGRGPSLGQPIARAAVDTAVFDLRARKLGLTLRELLGGGRDRREVSLSFTVTAHEPLDLERQVAHAYESGFRHFNYKLGVHPETDVSTAQCIRAIAGERVFVWADANQSLDLPAARLLSARLAEVGVNLFEQPVPADRFHHMSALRQATAMALAVDEASVGATDFFRYAAENLVDYLVVKLTRNGGIAPTLDQMAVARSAGLPMVISGLTESLLAKVAVCQVAAAWGCTGPAALNGSQFLDENPLFPEKPSLETGATVTLNDAPGLGVEPDTEALERWRDPAFTHDD